METRKMKVILVGQQDGKRKIHWTNYCLLSLGLAMIMGLGVGGVFYLLGQRWSHSAVVFGIVIGLGLAGVGLIRGMQTPIDKLDSLPER